MFPQARQTSSQHGLSCKLPNAILSCTEDVGIVITKEDQGRRNCSLASGGCEKLRHLGVRAKGTRETLLFTEPGPATTAQLTEFALLRRRAGADPTARRSCGSGRSGRSGRSGDSASRSSVRSGGRASQDESASQWGCTTRRCSDHECRRVAPRLGKLCLICRVMAAATNWAIKDAIVRESWHVSRHGLAFYHDGSHTLATSVGLAYGGYSRSKTLETSLHPASSARIVVRTSVCNC